VVAFCTLREPLHFIPRFPGQLPRCCLSFRMPPKGRVIVVLFLTALLNAASLRWTSAMRRTAATMMARGFGAAPRFRYSGNLRPGVQSPKAVVPQNIRRPDYADDGKPKGSNGSTPPWIFNAQSDETIAKMRVAGRYAREVLDEAVRLVRPGITTDEIDKLVHSETIKRNSYPSPLNYGGFPKSCCTSVNEVICHGIPDSTVLKDGDIVNIDVTVYHDGVHGDCSETVFVGDVDDKTKDLVQTTYDALQAAIAMCKPGITGLFRNFPQRPV
jgi:hypothetical protein